MYYFLANNSESCPELSGERLLTTVAEGESFEGLSVINDHSGGGDGGGGDYCGEEMVNMMMVMAMDTFHWIEQRVFLSFEGGSVINVANHWC